MGMYGGDNILDTAGITNLLKASSDAQVCSIFASLCSANPRLQEKMMELLVQPPAPRCTGTIKSFFPDKEYGFIDCPDTHAVYQKDVFLSGMQRGGFSPGQQVSFVVTLSKNGAPQAQDLQDENGNPSPQMGGGVQSQNLTPMEAVAPELHEELVQWRQAKQSKDFATADQIRNSLRARGVDPEKVTGMGGGMQKGGMKGGGMQMGGKGGMNQQQIGGGGFQMQAQMNRMNQGGMNQGGMNQGGMNQGGMIQGGNMMGGGGGMGNPPAKRARVDPNAPRAIGTIKHFNVEKKFGFIECAETFEQFGRDVYLGGMQVGTFQVGQLVDFAITVSAQGHPQAQDLQPVGGQAPAGNNNATFGFNPNNPADLGMTDYELQQLQQQMSM